jgi:hypothetical protein
MRKILWKILGLTAFLATGCGNVNPLVDPTGILYVLDHFNKAVYVFPDIHNLNGPLDPVRTISGNLTLIQDPASLAVDSRRDILYVADATSNLVLAFIPGSERDGNVAPRRTYPGINDPGQMVYEFRNDGLYVIDLSNNTVVIWDRISTLADGTGPTRVVTLDYEPSTLLVDEQRAELYLGDPDLNVLNIYVNVFRLDTADPPPINRTIAEATPSPSPSPSATPDSFENLDSLAMNVKNDILFVAESENFSIQIFDNASTIDSTTDGPVEPTRVLAGPSTGLGLDMGQILFLDNVLYAILSRTNVGVWDSANTVNGDVAPNRNIQVNGATEIVGIAVDLNH